MQVEETSTGHTLVDSEHAVPTRVLVHFQLEQPKFFIRLRIRSSNARHTVDRLEVIPGWREENGSFSDGDAGVTTTNLRQLLIDKLVRAVIESVRKPIIRLSPEERDFQRQMALRTSAIDPGFGINDQNVDQYLDTLFRVAGQPQSGGAYYLGGVPASELHGRGRETPSDRIRRAAKLYTGLVAAGSAAPIKEVAIALQVSPSQAGRYLKLARERGYLADDKSTE